ncbi:MAG: methyltransferase domain-containing protein [Cyanobacteria bacterium]|jgi:SAM-dependent methyltransferase|nr:methyltransferase domain-containing protein [Cyanobacteria bacterium GSL.Bin1]
MNIWNKKITNTYNSNLEKPWYPPALEMLQSIVSQEGFEGEAKLVELGVGMGEFAQLIRECSLPYKYLGLDGSPRQVDLLQKEGFQTTLVDFEDKIPLEADSVDVVVSLEVIEHIADAEQFVKEINRILKSSGVLILSTPNVGFALHRINYFLYAEVHQEGIHLRHFNQNKLKKILENYNFILKRKQSIMPLAVYNSFASRLGKQRKYVKCPNFVETWLASNFVWLMEKHSS